MDANLEANIWLRALPPDIERLTPQAAKALLQMKFRRRDVERINRLCARAGRGKTSEAERDELDLYIKLGNVLTLLHSKARIALKRGSSRARRKSA